MRDVSQRSSVISSLNVSVLAALNIADELFKLREQAQAYDNLAEEKVSNLLNLLEKED
jgi:cell division protein ZapA (FtsZ GTPase activity inhibitor)